MRKRSSSHAYARSAARWPPDTRFGPTTIPFSGSAGTPGMTSGPRALEGRVESPAPRGARLGREREGGGLAEVVVRVVARAEHVVPSVAGSRQRLRLLEAGDAAEVRAEGGERDVRRAVGLDVEDGLLDLLVLVGLDALAR